MVPKEISFKNLLWNLLIKIGETSLVRYNDELVPIEKLSLFPGPIRKCEIITKHFVFAFLYYYLHLSIFTVPRQSIRALL